jgi:cysteine desulfurase
MIYLDYNATTPLCEAARAAMLPYLERHFGNPSSIHSAGREARAAIDDARDQVASLLQAKPHELIFTGSGTEANNLAVLGLARSLRQRGRHLICSGVEHHAVLHAFEHLQQREGFEVTFLPVNSAGVVDPDDVARSIRGDTTLVSVMSANNETGVLQPMREIAEVCRAKAVLLHSDVVQAFGKAEENVVASVDAASFSAHKFYGPKGAGLLFLRAGIPIDPILFGGAHENQRRPGTENVAAIAGMAAAAEWVLTDSAAERDRQAALRDQLWRMIEAACPTAQENGAGAARVANTLNASFPGLDSETLLMALDLEGVCVSSGSACMVGSVVPSHVLLAMGVAPSAARSAVRFSLGKQTTEQEIVTAGRAIARIVQRLGARKDKHSTYAAA